MCRRAVISGLVIALAVIFFSPSSASAATPWAPSPAPSCPYSYLGSINGLYNRSTAPQFVPPRGDLDTNDGLFKTLELTFTSDILAAQPIPIIGAGNPGHPVARGFQWDSEVNDAEFQRQYDVNNECNVLADWQVQRDVNGKVDALSADVENVSNKVTAAETRITQNMVLMEGRLNEKLAALSDDVAAVQAQADANGAALAEVLANQQVIIELLNTPQGQRPAWPVKGG